MDPATLFKTLADDTRLRCLMLLTGEEELCVCELGFALGVAQPKISRHLALLRSSSVVLDRRSGQWIYYRIHPELPDWAHAILQQAALGAQEVDPFQDDRRRLLAMAGRPVRCG
ncbi:MAG: metalloregulator ArsR/SmtB family transcription factor [Magnetococcus sp. WYHC-3]